MPAETMNYKRVGDQPIMAQLAWMQNSVTYLNQRAFEAYIELINDGAKIDIAPQKPTGGTDI